MSEIIKLSQDEAESLAIRQACIKDMDWLSQNSREAIGFPYNHMTTLVKRQSDHKVFKLIWTMGEEGTKHEFRNLYLLEVG